MHIMSHKVAPKIIECLYSEMEYQANMSRTIHDNGYKKATQRTTFD